MDTATATSKVRPAASADCPLPANAAAAMSIIATQACASEQPPRASSPRTRAAMVLAAAPASLMR
jgi:hypothetical protein